eukprot:756813-Hanusia_phi.AAC.3
MGNFTCSPPHVLTPHHVMAVELGGADNHGKRTPAVAAPCRGRHLLERVDARPENLVGGCDRLGVLERAR